MQGRALKAIARETLGATSRTLLSQAFAQYLDRLPIDWNYPRGSGEVNALTSSFTNALRYAFLHTTGAVPPLDSPDARTAAITDLLSDEAMSAIFRANAWRAPTSYSPLRGVILQYILHHRYGGAAIRGIDVGAGLNILIPMLNSREYLDAGIPHKDAIISSVGHVNVTLGLGIDKQDRDVLWALASCPWSRSKHVAQLRNSLAANDQKTFPFLVADISENTTARRVDSTINPTGDTPHVDFVVSLFCRYQLNNDEGTQRAYQQFAPTFLADGGLLIEDGEAVTTKEFRINVFQKVRGEMRFTGSPFTIATDGQIRSVDLSYFMKSDLSHG
jgi:hypothetical protein